MHKILSNNLLLLGCGTSYRDHLKIAANEDRFDQILQHTYLNQPILYIAVSSVFMYKICCDT